jgi:hypothetical protein
MGLFKTKADVLNALDFPCFFGEYPFKDKLITESIVIVSKQTVNLEDCIVELGKQAKDRGFDAITHIGFNNNEYDGSTQGHMGFCNAIKVGS